MTSLTPRVVVLGPLLPSAAGSQEGLHCKSCRQQQSHLLYDKPVVHHQLVFHHDNSQESTLTGQRDAKGGSVLLLSPLPLSSQIPLSIPLSSQISTNLERSQHITPTRQGDAKGGSVLLQLFQSPGQAFHLSAVPGNPLVIFGFKFLSSLTVAVWRW